MAEAALFIDPGQTELLVDKESGKDQHTQVFLLGGPEEFPVVLWRAETTVKCDEELAAGQGVIAEGPFAEWFKRGTAATSRLTGSKLKLEDCVIGEAQSSGDHFRFGAVFTFVKS